MLIITRRPGDKIYIDGTIVVEILGFDRGTCRVGIVAPQHMDVSRDELHEFPERQEIERRARGESG